MIRMTSEEQMLWDYIDEESDTLLLKMREQVVTDGFYAMVKGDTTAVENVSLKIISAAMIKTLAIMCEERGGTDLMQAYVEMAPMHASLMKSFMLKEIRR